MKKRHSKEYLKKWRSSPSGKASVQKAREKSKEKMKVWSKEYYAKNRAKILKKTSEYNKTHPEVRKKITR